MPPTDYSRHLQGWSGGAGMPAAGRGRTPANTRRGRPAGARTQTQTTTRNRNRTTGGRVLNAAQDTPATAFSPLFARNLANALGVVSNAVAMSGIPLEIAQQIVTDGYSGKG